MATFSASYAGIGQMLRSNPVRAEMLRRARLGLAFAQATAPRRSGGYAAAFGVRSVSRGGKRKDRAEAILYNSHPAALVIEVGSGKRNTPAHRTLTRSIDAMRD